MVTIFAIIFVLILMTVVIFFILKNTVSNINEQGRVYFTLKLQQYEKEYEKVNQDKERNKGLEENVQKVTDITSMKPTGSLVYIDEKLDYQVSDLLALVKKIEKGFIVDTEEIIKAFIKEKTDRDSAKKYEKLKEVKDYIMGLGVYNILTNNEEGFIEKVQIEIERIDHKSYQRYLMSCDEFEIEDFLNFLENEMGICDPTIYIVIGDEDKDYNHIDDRIETIYDEKVYKGVKIIYKNKLYDYSLS